MYLVPLISFSVITFFSSISFSLECGDNIDEQGVIENQVVCDDGEIYNLTPLEDSIKIKKRLEEARLFEKQLKLDEQLIETYERKIQIHESIVSIYKTKSELDDETVKRLMAITLEEEPFYKTNEFSFVVGAAVTVTAFVLWRYTEQFTE